MLLLLMTLLFQRDAAPTIVLVQPPTMPGILKEAALQRQPDESFAIAAEISNPTGEALERVELTFVLQSHDGVTRASRDTALALDELPIEPGGVRTITIPLYGDQLDSQDFLSVAVTTASGLSDAWRYETFLSDAEQAMKVPKILMVQPPSCPIRFSTAEPLQSGDSPPRVVRYSIANVGTAIATNLSWVTLLFDQNGVVRFEKIQHFYHPLGAGALAWSDEIEDVPNIRNWHIAVGLRSVLVGGALCGAPDAKTAAREQMAVKPRWPPGFVKQLNPTRQ